MPQLLTDPAHWRLRAQQAQQLAQRSKDPLERAAKLEMASKYDRLAARATEGNCVQPTAAPLLDR